MGHILSKIHTVGLIQVLPVLSCCLPHNASPYSWLPFLWHSINKETQRLEFHINAILIMIQGHGLKHSESNGCLNIDGIILSIWCVRVSHLTTWVIRIQTKFSISTMLIIKKTIIHKGNKVSNNMWFPPKNTNSFYFLTKIKLFIWTLEVKQIWKNNKITWETTSNLTMEKTHIACPLYTQRRSFLPQRPGRSSNSIHCQSAVLLFGEAFWELPMSQGSRGFRL